MRSLRAWAGNLLLLALGLGIPLLGAEAGLRLVSRTKPGGKEQVERNRYTEYDPLLGWRKKPRGHVTYVRRDYRSDFVINDLGLRGPSRPHAKPATTLRVLALGDSFVEAFMVRDEETVTGQLEARLRSRLGCSVEVINGGTVGYSTDQEYLFYREEGRQYSPDLTILFTYHNDIPYLVREKYYDFPKPRLSFDESPVRVINEPVPRYQPAPELPAPPSPPFRGSYLLEFVKDRVERGSARTYNRIASWGVWEPLRTLPPNAELDLFRVPPYGHLNSAWSAYTWTLESLHNLIGAYDSELMVAYVPSRMEVNDADYEITEARYGVTPASFDRRAVSSRIEMISGRFKIPFLDFSKALRDGDTRFQPVYFPTDSHWNARGQAIAAETAAAFIAGQHLLTCPAI